MVKVFNQQFKKGQGRLRETTSNITLDNGDFLILADATAGPITVTLFKADGWGGKRFCIKKVDSSANAVTVAPITGETIDGAASVVLSGENDSLDVISDNENYVVIAVAVGGASGIQTSILLAELNANQTGVGNNTDIVWDLETLKIGTDISLNTATGEFTIQPGTYDLNAELRALGFSLANGNVRPEWVDGANTSLNKSAAVLLPVTHANQDANQATAHTLLTVTVATVVKVRITSAAGTVEIRELSSRAIIKKLV